MGSKNNNNNFFELSFEIVNSNDKELKSTVGLEPVGPVHKYSLILIFNIQTGFWDVRFCFSFSSLPLFFLLQAEAKNI